MLVIVDEAGDPGRKTDSGSTRYFAVTAVLFQDRCEANRCDAAIDSLRERLRVSPRKEFHFSKDNDRIRESFLRTVEPFDFQYSSVVLNKNRLTHPGFHVKESLYKYTVNLTFKNLEPLLEDAIVVFDRCGGRVFVNELRNYLRRRGQEWSAEDGRRRIKKVKADRSDRNNLVQMADMVGGSVYRSHSDRKDCHRFRRIIQSREHRVQMWPAEPHAGA